MDRVKIGIYRITITLVLTGCCLSSGKLKPDDYMPSPFTKQDLKHFQQDLIPFTARDKMYELEVIHECTSIDGSNILIVKCGTSVLCCETYKPRIKIKAPSHFFEESRNYQILLYNPYKNFAHIWSCDGSESGKPNVERIQIKLHYQINDIREYDVFYN